MTDRDPSHYAFAFGESILSNYSSVGKLGLGSSDVLTLIHGVYSVTPCLPNAPPVPINALKLLPPPPPPPNRIVPSSPKQQSMMQEIQMLKSQVEMLQGELGRVKVSDDTQSLDRDSRVTSVRRSRWRLWISVS